MDFPIGQMSKDSWLPKCSKTIIWSVHIFTTEGLRLHKIWSFMASRDLFAVYFQEFPLKKPHCAVSVRCARTRKTSTIDSPFI